jgi:hypothetical protein
MATESGEDREAEQVDATEEAPPPADTLRGRSRDPKVFVLLRELSEVHLLLDNVSANPTTTVSELGPVALPEELGPKWIEKVCDISWPPDGSTEEKAADAALLIRAKDYLNRLSHPASGSTIAFTLLVTQGARDYKWRLKKGGMLSARQSPTRSSLAQAAYPDLVSKAAGFRRWMAVISVGLLVTLLLTCALSWYVAYGNEVLTDYAKTQEASVAAKAKIADAENSEAETPAAATGTKAPPFKAYCDRPPSAEQSQLCKESWRISQNVQRVQRRLYGWLCAAPFSGCDPDDVARPKQDLPDVEKRSYDDKLINAPARAAALATIMGSAVLPFLYGLLGAGAAIIRSLSRKIRSSLLSPRDLHLSFQQLALGAVIGACIGLFIGAPGSDNAGEGLLGPVTLSASAISFVAGFGVEAVFQALEALIQRIFNIAPIATANRGDGVASN